MWQCDHYMPTSQTDVLRLAIDVIIHGSISSVTIPCCTNCSQFLLLKICENKFDIIFLFFSLYVCVSKSLSFFLVAPFLINVEELEI